MCYNIYMPYHVGEKGSYGCSGYPALKDDGTVMGCHTTAAEAADQIYAINQSEGNIDEKEMITNDGGMSVKNPDEWPVKKADPCWEGAKNKALFSNFGKDWTTSRGLPELFR